MYADDTVAGKTIENIDNHLEKDLRRYFDNSQPQ